jgi:putative cardiolipin synthase
VDRPPDKNPARADEAPVQVAKALRKLIDSAESEVILISAYLIPTPELEAAIERAERRGVQVRILTNSLRSNNHTAAHASYRRHISRLVDQGADLHELRSDGKDRGRHMLGSARDRSLALHAKCLIIDDDRVFIGSCNLDARSLRINTEMGLLIRSTELNHQLRKAVQLDFHPRNAWHLQRQPNGAIHWVGDDRTLTSQPAASSMQRLEDWIFSLLPIEGEM